MLTEEKYQQIEQWRKEGLTQIEAIQKARIARDTYYKYRRARGLQERVRNSTARKPRSPQGFTLTIPTDDQPLVILMGKSSDVTQALERLSQIRGRG